MPGPHPAVAAVRSAVRPHVEAPVLVACSGGADSLALATAVAFEARGAAGLITVDHGLQEGSAEQAQRVAELGYELGFDPVEVVPVTVGRRGGREAAARAARYAALDAAAAALDRHVLLGHTLDDQAETVLLGLGRGSGPRSISGMRVQAGRYRRPFLRLRRTTTVAACDALGIPYWEDPQNLDSSLQRVRLRREVLPLLEDVLQGGVAEALARTAAQLQDDDDALAGWAAAAGGSPELDVAVLETLPRAVRTRVLHTWAVSAGATEVTAEHVARLDALVADWHGQRGVDLPGRIRVIRLSARLVLESPNPRS